MVRPEEESRLLSRVGDETSCWIGRPNFEEQSPVGHCSTPDSAAAQLASDRVALGGFPPRALADPYVLALEHTVPQSWVCCMPVNRMDGSYTRQRVSLERALKADPVERAVTVPAKKPLPPPTLNLGQEP